MFLVESWEMYVKIDIADTGIGISEQHQGAIFKRFYREDIVHDVDGIGISLYLAREIVTLQGGYIRVTSEVGRVQLFPSFCLDNKISTLKNKMSQTYDI